MRTGGWRGTRLTSDDRPAAKSSLKPEDAVPDTTGLEPAEEKTLQQWYDFFSKVSGRQADKARSGWRWVTRRDMNQGLTLLPAVAAVQHCRQGFQLDQAGDAGDQQECPLVARADDHARVSQWISEYVGCSGPTSYTRRKQIHDKRVSWAEANLL